MQKRQSGSQAAGSNSGSRAEKRRRNRWGLPEPAVLLGRCRVVGWSYVGGEGCVGLDQEGAAEGRNVTVHEIQVFVGVDLVQTGSDDNELVDEGGEAVVQVQGLCVHGGEGQAGELLDQVCFEHFVDNHAQDPAMDDERVARQSAPNVHHHDVVPGLLAVERDGRDGNASRREQGAVEARQAGGRVVQVVPTPVLLVRRVGSVLLDQLQRLQLGFESGRVLGAGLHVLGGRKRYQLFPRLVQGIVVTDRGAQ